MNLTIYGKIRSKLTLYVDSLHFTYLYEKTRKTRNMKNCALQELRNRQYGARCDAKKDFTQAKNEQEYVKNILQVARHSPANHKKNPPKSLVSLTLRTRKPHIMRKRAIQALLFPQGVWRTQKMELAAIAASSGSRNEVNSPSPLPPK